jgi:hypothetical protein
MCFVSNSPHFFGGCWPNLYIVCTYVVTKHTTLRKCTDKVNAITLHGWEIRLLLESTIGVPSVQNIPGNSHFRRGLDKILSSDMDRLAYFIDNNMLYYHIMRHYQILFSGTRNNLCPLTVQVSFVSIWFLYKQCCHQVIIMAMKTWHKRHHVTDLPSKLYRYIKRNRVYCIPWCKWEPVYIVL